MYCVFNPKTFKSFISMKEKITPEFANDWEILPVQYNSLKGITLYSKSINQSVADIDFYNFLILCKDENITIKGGFLEGDFIIGNQSPGLRKVYTKKMHEKYLKKYSQLNEKIDIKELSIGRQISTKCGSQHFYLGDFYEFKDSRKQKYKKMKLFISLDGQYSSYENKNIGKLLNFKIEDSLIKDLYNSFFFVGKLSYNARISKDGYYTPEKNLKLEKIKVDSTIENLFRLHKGDFKFQETLSDLYQHEKNKMSREEIELHNYKRVANIYTIKESLEDTIHGVKNNYGYGESYYNFKFYLVPEGFREWFDKTKGFKLEKMKLEKLKV